MSRFWGGLRNDVFGKGELLLEWFFQNIGTFAVLAIVAVFVGIAVFSMLKDKKQGKCSCGSSCSACPMSGKCGQRDK